MLNADPLTAANEGSAGQISWRSRIRLRSVEFGNRVNLYFPGTSPLKFAPCGRTY